jgi:Arc/MetJ-type ribon-helix-helix transcriptional regulator
MPYPFPQDIQELVAAQLTTGRYADENAVLRDALAVLREVETEAIAVQAAIDEWRAGDVGVPLDQAIEAAREQSRHRPSA